jgi:MraZ protein
MFLGTYQYSIDGKGRLFFPAKLRDDEDEKSQVYVLTRGLEECLYLFRAVDFQNIVMGRLTNISVQNQQKARAFKRMLLAGAQEVVLDDMGRLLIPKSLMEFSGLEKDVSILGVGERVELWDSKKWATYSKKAAHTFQKMGRHLEI